MSGYGYNNYNQGQGYNPQQQGQGEAASYYASAGQSYGQQQQQQQFQSGNGQQQQQFQDGPAGERGVLGAIGGGLAGGFGGNAIGGKTGHTKTSTIIGAIAGAVAGHKLQDGVSDWKDKRDEEKEEEKRREEEDKRRRKEDEERRKREEEDRKKNQHGNNNNYQQQQQHHNRGDSGTKYTGGFSGSCKDMSLDHAGGEYVLRAQCRGRDGSYRSSSIALNGIISNDRGCFRWAAPSHQSSNGCGGGGRPAEYTVVANDTLRQIGGKFGIDWQEIARHNCIQNPDLIYPGQVLKIPGGGGNSHGHQNGGGSAGNFGASARNVRLEDCGKKLVAELKRDGQWVSATLVLDERIGNDNGALRYVS